MTIPFDAAAAQLETQWATEARWQGILRPYTAADVVRLRGSVTVEHSLARQGAERLWSLLNTEDYINALGALSGAQAVEMVKAGLQAIYLSGWQVAADANLSEQVYPDQSLYAATSVPAVVRRINNALRRADQIEWAESGGGRRGGRPPPLDGPDRGRRRSRLRRRPQRLRADEGHDRGRRGRRALRGPAVVGEEVRPHGRQGPGSDQPSTCGPSPRPAWRPTCATSRPWSWPEPTPSAPPC